MPGRGTPWRKGKGKEGRIAEHDIEDDSVESIDIKDGTIQEVDLDSALQAKVNLAGGHGIQDEGTPLPTKPNLNFIGAGVTASDGVEDTTDITIAGGGGSLSREDLADPFTDFWFYDEFFYPDPSVHFPHYEKSVNSLDASTATVGGAVDYQTTNVANNVARINICGAGMQVIDSSKRLIMKCRVQNFTGSLGTAGLMVGHFTASSDGPGGTFPFSNKTSRGLGFLLDGTGNIKTYSDDGITPETTDTGVSQDLLMHVYEVDFDPAGTPTITYKIDGNIVKTQTTNLPSFNGSWYCNGQTSEAVGKDFRLDSLFIFNER